jgi:hypothetical protein
MTKTPYELRYDLLMMAKSIINENLMNDRIRLENEWNMKRDIDMSARERGVTVEGYHPFPEIPKMDPNAVIEMAKLLNNFVSNTGE